MSASDDFECCVCGRVPQEPFVSEVPDRLGAVAERATYVRCTRCGLVALSPRPSLDQIATFYPSSFWRTHAAGAPETLAQRFEERFRERLIELEMALIEPYLQPGLKHLDVGCATGDFIVRCQARGLVSAGIEFGEAAVRHCREERGLDVWQGDLVAHDFGGRKFDLITYNGVLEHVPDPMAHLRRCATLLEPGGKVLVSGLPNIEALGFRVAGKNWVSLDAPRHLHQFSRGSLTTMLGSAGFRVLALDCRSPRFNPPSLVASVFPPLHRHKFDAYQLATGKNPLLRKAALLGLLQVARPIDWVVARAGLGEHLSCVAGLA